jgi:hypothetical protein
MEKPWRSLGKRNNSARPTACQQVWASAPSLKNKGIYGRTPNLGGVSQKKTAAPAGPRDGGKEPQESPGKGHSQRKRFAGHLASFAPVWSDDRRHLLGWEVRHA